MPKSRNNNRNKLEKIIYVSWEESERGWGTRPDGCSLHLTKEDYSRFLKDYWKEMPREVPDEYSRPAGEPVEAFASRRLYLRIKNSKTKYGLWIIPDEQRNLEKSKDLKYGAIRTGWVPIK